MKITRINMMIFNILCNPIEDVTWGEAEEMDNLTELLEEHYGAEHIVEVEHSKVVVNQMETNLSEDDFLLLTLKHGQLSEFIRDRITFTIS